MAVQVSPNSTTSGTRAEKAKAAALRIESASKAQSPLKMVVYGRNGMGKTYFTGTSNLKTLLVDCEEKGFDAVSDRPNMDVYQLSLWDELQYLYWHLKSGKHDYDVVVIDTITMLSTLCLKWILGDERARDSSADPLMPDKRHYGKLGIAMTNMIIEWRNLPVHVIFLAQERKFVTETEEGEVLTEIGPSMTPMPLSTLLGAVGTIGRLYKREVSKNGKTVEERRMLVSGNDKYIAKTRIRGTKKVIINPRLDGLLALRAKRGEVPEGEVAANTAEEL